MAGKGVAVKVVEGLVRRRVWIWIWQHWMMDDSKALIEAGGTASRPFWSRVRSTAVWWRTRRRQSLASLHSQTSEEHSDGRSRGLLTPGV